MTAPDVTTAVERVRAAVDDENCHWNLVGPAEHDAVDVLVSDARTILSELDRLSAALVEVEGQAGSVAKSIATHGLRPDLETVTRTFEHIERIARNVRQQKEQ